MDFKSLQWPSGFWVGYTLGNCFPHYPTPASAVPTAPRDPRHNERNTPGRCPPLNIQIFVFVVLTIVVAAGFWIERATFSAEFEGPWSTSVRMQANRAIRFPMRSRRRVMMCSRGAPTLTKAEAALDRVLATAGTKESSRRVGDDPVAGPFAKSSPSNARHQHPAHQRLPAGDGTGQARSPRRGSSRPSAQHGVPLRRRSRLSLHLGGAMTLIVTGGRPTPYAGQRDRRDQQRTKAVDGLTHVIRQALDDDEVQLSASEQSPLPVVSDASPSSSTSRDGANKEMARSNFLHLQGPLARRTGRPCCAP